MDYAKLTNLNGIYIRQADDDRLTQDVLQRLAHRPDLSLGSHAAARIRALMPALKERAKTLVELADSAAFLARVVPLPMEPKAAAALTAEARLMLREVARPWRRPISRPCDRCRLARLRRAERPEAGPGGAAAARGTDRQHGQSGDRCDAGRAGPGRGAGTDRRRFRLTPRRPGREPTG